MYLYIFVIRGDWFYSSHCFCSLVLYVDLVNNVNENYKSCTRPITLLPVAANARRSEVNRTIIIYFHVPEIDVVAFISNIVKLNMYNTFQIFITFILCNNS